MRLSIQSGFWAGLLLSAGIAGSFAGHAIAEPANGESWQLAQASRDAGTEEEQRRKRRDGRRDQRSEQREDTRRSGPRQDSRQPSSRPPSAAEERRQAPARKEAQPQAPSRREARPPTTPAVINERRAGQKLDSRENLRAKQKEIPEKRRDAREERRDDRKDARQERQEDRKDARDVRQERKEDRRDASADRKGDRAERRVHRLEDLKQQRRQRVEDGGKRTIIEEPGNRTIVREQGRTIIRHDETERFRRRFKDTRVERRRDGSTETIFVRPDGTQVISVTDSRGRLLHRYRRHRDGRTVVLIDNRRYHRPGFVDGLILGAILDLRPPVVRIPRERYIVEYEDASFDDVYEALSAPPVDELERGYSLDEVRYNRYLRERMRRIDLDSINFEFGSWEVPADQFHKLERIAKAIDRLLERNPDEIIMIEGHTDAVGSDEDNLTLSDRRAETVAEILADEFGIPPENLITQGYGEQFLKVETQAAERANRRVAMRRITPLLSRSED